MGIASLSDDTTHKVSRIDETDHATDNTTATDDLNDAVNGQKIGEWLDDVVEVIRMTIEVFLMDCVNEVVVQ